MIFKLNQLVKHSLVPTLKGEVLGISNFSSALQRPDEYLVQYVNAQGIPAYDWFLGRDLELAD